MSANTRIAGPCIDTHVARVHGGTISAQARVDGPGTMMVFTLPRVDPAQAQRAGETTSAEPPPRRTGSETAVSRPLLSNSIAVAAPI